MTTVSLSTVHITVGDPEAAARPLPRHPRHDDRPPDILHEELPLDHPGRPVTAGRDRGSCSPPSRTGAARRRTATPWRRCSPRASCTRSTSPRPTSTPAFEKIAAAPGVEVLQSPSRLQRQARRRRALTPPAAGCASSKLLDLPSRTSGASPCRPTGDATPLRLRTPSLLSPSCGSDCFGSISCSRPFGAAGSRKGRPLTQHHSLLGLDPEMGVPCTYPHPSMQGTAFLARSSHFGPPVAEPQVGQRCCPHRCNYSGATSRREGRGRTKVRVDGHHHRSTVAKNEAMAATSEAAWESTRTCSSQEHATPRPVRPRKSAAVASCAKTASSSRSPMARSSASSAA